MTSSTTAERATAADDRTGRRPLVATCLLGGASAALAVLVVLMAVGVVGWFLSDAGVHGTPRDGMRVGALAWLAAHGAGIGVGGVSVTVVPLGLTIACAWTIARIGHRVGTAVAGHGPDADRIGDGERDLTVPTAVLSFFAGYLLTALATAVIARADGAGMSLTRVVLVCAGLCVVVAAPTIAVGSGRAAIWAAGVPAPVRMGVRVAWAVLRAYLLVSLLVFTVALLVNLDDAATVLSRLHTTPAEGALYAVVSATFVPNASLLTGSYLLGPGFLVGVGNVVTPSGVSLGALPLFPLVAALPGPGPVPGWMAAVLFVPALVAALATARVLRHVGTLRWDQTLLAATGGGLLAGVLLTVVTSLAGGAAGPGRMREVGAPTSEVLVHALTGLGLGSLVGALVVVLLARARGGPDDGELPDAAPGRP